METKKILTIVAVIAVVGVVGYEVALMAGIGGGEDVATQEAATKAAPTVHPDTPKTVALIPPPPPAAKVLTPEEQQAMKVQQENQARYIDALNTLQMLKVQKDIADANKDIMKAKEDMITSEHKIVDMLKPVQTTNPTAFIDSGGHAVSPSSSAPSSMMNSNSGGNNEISVVSITNLQGRWKAVLSTGSRLISVSIGDELADDHSTVIGIDRSGITLEKQGVKRKVMMASVI
jgi:hypothetical protein